MLWIATAVTTRRAADVRRHQGSLQVRIDRQRAGRFVADASRWRPAPLLDLQKPAGICPDKLPGGFASVGFIVEPGHDLPIGVSRRRRLGIDQVGLNCATCHTGTVRDSPDAAPRIVLGMPSHQLDLQSFVEFVLDCTLDNRLTTGRGGRPVAEA